MFCNKCGQENNNHSNYCKKDGSSLKTKSKSINMKKTQAKYCSGCGSDTTPISTYCKSCGTGLFNITKKSSAMNVVDKTKNLNEVKSLSNIGVERSIDIKKILKLSGIGLFIVFLTNLFMAYLGNSFINDGIGNSEKIKILRAIDLTLLSNLVGTELNIAYSGMAGGTLSLKGGFLPFMMIPSLVFIVIGIITAKKDIQEEGRMSIKNLLLVGLSYGVALFIIAIMARVSLNIPIVEISIVKKFHIIGALFRGVLISTISMLFGYIAYFKLKKREDLLSYYECLTDGIFNFGIFLGFTVIILPIFSMIAIMVEENIFINDSQIFVFLLLLVNISAYVFPILNFATFKFTAYEYGVSEEMSTSLFSLNKLKDEFGRSSITLVYISLIVPIIIFVMYGRKIKRKYGQDIKRIIQASVVYSALTSCFAYMMNINISTSGNLSLLDLPSSLSASLGFNIFVVFICSFIFSSIVTLAGNFLSNSN